MAYVVDQSRNANSRPFLARNVVLPGEPFKDARRQMKRSERMCKPRMLSRLIRKVGEAQLPDPPKPLKFRGIDQRDQKVAFRRARFDSNYVMNRITVDFFRQDQLQKLFYDSVSFHLDLQDVHATYSIIRKIYKILDEWVFDGTSSLAKKSVTDSVTVHIVRVIAETGRGVERGSQIAC